MLGLEAQLKQTIIPFWKNMKDSEHGGFYGSMDNQLNIDKHSDKSLIASARYLYAFSLWYGYFKDNSLLEDAKHAYQFIINNYKDHNHNGYYWQVKYDGTPNNLTKHIYSHAFLIYGLSEYYQVTQDELVLNEALRIFQLIEDKAHEAKNIYHEEFSVDWEKKENKLLSDHGFDYPYTTNTLLHLLEAYTSLYKISHKKEVKKSLLDLILVFKQVLYDKKNQLFRMYIDINHQPSDIGQSYGHDIESCWLIDEACKAISYEDQEVNQMLSNVTNAVYNRGFTRHGLLSENINGNVCEDRIWWIQAEAMVGFYNQFKKTAQVKYLKATQHIYRFTIKNIVDSRPNSEWFWGIDKNNEHIVDKGIAGPWKAPYHNGRAFTELLKRGLT